MQSTPISIVDHILPDRQGDRASFSGNSAASTDATITSHKARTRSSTRTTSPALARHSHTVLSATQPPPTQCSDFSTVSLPRNQEPSSLSMSVVSRPPPGSTDLPSAIPRKRTKSNHRSGTSTAGSHTRVATQQLQDLITLKQAIAQKRVESLARLNSGPPSAYTLPTAEGRRSPGSSDDGHRPPSTRSQSSASSSLYPKSAMSKSSTSGRTPTRAAFDSRDNDPLQSYDREDGPSPSKYESDDMSYRLNLMVKNSYFLPPAHAKPTLSDLKGDALKKSTRTVPPAFLDLFRVGKSRPASSTDCSSSSYSLNGSPLLLSQAGFPTSTETTGRVVVVREIVDDIVSAAREAEQDMKRRERQRSESSHTSDDSFEDVVDPTDIVDAPPEPLYPFEIQASAASSLGVHDSVGAIAMDAILKGSTHSIALSPGGDDSAWRSQLLHEAVGHSLQLSPRPQSSSLAMKRRSVSADARPRLGAALTEIGGLIVQRPFALSDEEEDGTHVSRHSRDIKTKNLAHASTSTSHMRADYVPPRVATPATPTTPLAPAPRSQVYHTSRNVSDTALPFVPTNLQPAPRPLARRRTKSTPTMVDDRAAQSAQVVPPLPSPKTPTASGWRTNSLDIPNMMPRLSTSSGVRSLEVCNEDDFASDTELPTINSLRDSNELGRQSLSEVSHQAPSVSAFQDSAYDGYVSSSTVPDFGDLVTSPPPRTSSSRANLKSGSSKSIKLPPSRAASLRPQQPRRPSSSESAPSVSASFLEGLHGDMIRKPSLAQRRSGVVALSVDVARAVQPKMMPVSSPAFFFDAIEDDMEDMKSDSDDDRTQPRRLTLSPLVLPSGQYPAPNSPASSSRRSALKRLGNRSAPNITRASARDVSVASDWMKPVTNVPPPTRSPFKAKFSKNKYSDSVQFIGLDPPELPFLDNRYRSSTDSGSGGSSNGQAQSPKTPTREQIELQRKFDGLLKNHMDTERDIIQKITRTHQSLQRA